MGGKSDYCPSYLITPLAGIQSHADQMNTATAAGGAAGVKVVVGPFTHPRELEGLGQRQIAHSTAAFAGSVDVVILCLGGAFGSEGKDQVGNTGLPSDQLAMVSAALSNNSKTAVVLLHGNPMALDTLTNITPGVAGGGREGVLTSITPGSTTSSTTSRPSSNSSGVSAGVHTIVDAFEGGQSAGTALAAILFGDMSPSGVLPWTVYPSAYTSQVKMTDMSMRAGGIGRTYRFYKGEPTFPFFHGLSYTTFNLSWSKTPDASRTVAQMAAGLEYSVTVHNTGKMGGSKVVAAFVRWTPAAAVVVAAPVLGSTASTTTTSTTADEEPIKQLFAVEKVHLNPGESATVTLGSNGLPGHCSFCSVDDQGLSKVRPGSFVVTIGDGGTKEGSEVLTHAIKATP
jgi:hypothetical protein